MQSNISHRGLVGQITTLVAIIAAFVVNVWSNIFPIGGLNIGKISNTLFNNVLITPANYAFAIWGLIYLGLLALGIYQFLPAQRNDSDLRKIGYLLAIACVSQIAWVYLFLLRMFVLSVVAMLGILLPLIGIYLQLTNRSILVSRIQKWCVRFPISIYLSWISVATIVNVACALYAASWDGWGISATTWTILMVIIASAIAFRITTQYADTAYTWVTVWALVAVAIKQSGNLPLLTVTLSSAIVLTILNIMHTRIFQRNH
jgi:hypothetical protein